MKCWRTATVFNLKNFLQLKSAAARLILALVLFLAVGATAQTNALSDAEIQGRQLAQQLCNARPETNFFQNGHLNIRSSKGNQPDIPILFYTEIHTANWETTYQISAGPNASVLVVVHGAGAQNRYSFFKGQMIKTATQTFKNLSGDRIMVPFGNSDFWIADLGLEFFHWSAQKVLPKTTNLKRGRDYTLLESANPNPPTNGYSRVLSWIDKESGGILFAEAYDANGKLLKEFEPKSFKKVNGQWELQEMEIRNVQTGSRTRLEFDLKSD
jgi:Outer membrane lipoprotein-sorting protein